MPNLLLTMLSTVTAIGVVVTAGSIDLQDRGRSEITVIVLGHPDHGGLELQQALEETFAATGQPVESTGERRAARRSSDSTVTLRYSTAASRYVQTACGAAAGCEAALRQGTFSGALLVVSAVDGPMPATREQAALARKAGVERIVVVLTRAARINDQELLQLVELETRDLLKSLGFAGEIAIVRDNEPTWIAKLLREMDRRFVRR
jgi:elongation factor Tu